MFGIAAVVLAALAAIFQFAGFHQISPAGLAYTALACLALHLTWPVTPWRNP
jgi:hypothetical protein